MEDKHGGTDKQRHKELRSKAFVMAIEIIFIFGIPALVAFFGGGWLDERFDTGETLRLVALALAFIFSWVIVIVRALNINKAFKEVEDKKGND